MHIRRLTDEFAVAATPTPADFDALYAAGFRTVINFRPDGESPGQIPSRSLSAHARDAGLRYVDVPASKFELFTSPVVDGAHVVLKSAQGPVLGFCASGQRAAIVWAAARARDHAVDQVLGVLKSSGFDFSFLRDDLEAQADRSNWHHADSTTPQFNAFEPA